LRVVGWEHPANNDFLLVSQFSVTGVRLPARPRQLEMIRLLLRDLKSAGRIECLGRGPGAKWRKRVIPSKEGNKEGNNPIA
jgi:hypothetical protein